MSDDGQQFVLVRNFNEKVNKNGNSCGLLWMM
jgi:hypothetical protein